MANDTPKICAEPKAMPSATASTERVNSSREPVRATTVSSQGTTRGPRMIAIAAKAATLPSVTSTVVATAKLLPPSAPAPPVPPSTPAKAGSSTSASTMVRSSVISQPTATRPIGALTWLLLLERLEHHHRTRHRQAEAEHQPGAERPAEEMAEQDAEPGREPDLDHCAGHRQAAHRDQVGGRKMQADAEHQQDNADVGQLRGEIAIGDVSRRERPHQDAGEQIADQRRQMQPVRQVTEPGREHKADGKGGEKGNVLMQ